MIKVILIFFAIFGLLSATIINGWKVVRFVVKNWKIILVMLISAIAALGIIFI